MKNTFQEINNLIIQEINSINTKIKGTSFLEILKSKIIDKDITQIDKNLFQNISDNKYDSNFEDDFKKCTIRLKLENSPSILLNNKLKNNLLLICLSGIIKIDIEDLNSRKNANINLIPNTGITLPKDTLCNVNYSKNSIYLDIKHNDKTLNIENLKDNTI